MDKAKMKALALALLAGTMLSAGSAMAQTESAPAPTGSETKILPKDAASGGAAGGGGVEAQGEAQPQDMGATTAPEAEQSGQAASDTADAPATGDQQTDTAAQPETDDDSSSTAAAPETGDADEQQATSGDAPSQETTGSIDISSEQQTEIRSVFVENKVEPVDIDVEVSVGVAVPKTVTLHPLPPRIVEILPAYEGYEYFILADGRIVIVKPATYEVVYVLAG